MYIVKPEKITIKHRFGLGPSAFKVNRQGHRRNSNTIGIFDHKKMGIAFEIVFLSALHMTR
jgi:hypothetical protein